MDIDHLMQEMRDLGPKAIRARIEELDAQIKALRVLLRAAMQARKPKDRQEAAR
jgi:hypothetical protein